MWNEYDWQTLCTCSTSRRYLLPSSSNDCWSSLTLTDCKPLQRASISLALQTQFHQPINTQQRMLQQTTDYESMKLFYTFGQSGSCRPASRALSRHLFQGGVWNSQGGLSSGRRPRVEARSAEWGTGLGRVWESGGVTPGKILKLEAHFGAIWCILATNWYVSYASC